VDKRGRGWEGEEGEVMCIRGVGDGRRYLWLSSTGD